MVVGKGYATGALKGTDGREDTMAKSVPNMIDVSAQFIVTAITEFPSDDTRRASVIVILDGDDADAQAIYTGLHEAGVGGLPAPPLAQGKMQPLVCAHATLKAVLDKLGMGVGNAHDAEPPARTARVFGATNGQAGIRTVTVAAPAGQA